MQNSGVAAGLAPAERIIIATSAQATRKGAAAPLSDVGAVERLDRRDHAQFGRRFGDSTGVLGVIADRVNADPGFAGPDRRRGAASSAYLAQHIAQEVTPEDPGFDRFQEGARAYVMRRDSTMEFLAADNRLDIRV